jgi:hypothetical protein
MQTAETLNPDQIGQFLKMSDTECACKMTTAKAKLLRECKTESPVPPPRFQ